MTTTGRTTSCSANRRIARGSERRTEVSSTWVLRPSRHRRRGLGVVLRLADHGRLPPALRAPRRAPDTGVLPEQDHAPTYRRRDGGGRPLRNGGPDPALLPERMLHGLASRGRRSLSSTAEHKPGARPPREAREGVTRCSPGRSRGSDTRAHAEPQVGARRGRRDDLDGRPQN